MVWFNKLIKQIFVTSSNYLITLKTLYYEKNNFTFCSPVPWDCALSPRSTKLRWAKELRE